MAEMHTEKGDDKETANRAGEDGQPEGGQKPEAGKEGKTFTQEDVDRIIAERLDREKKAAEKAAAKAVKEAEEKALTDQAEWQKLAQTRQATIADLEGKVAELEGAQERADRYEKALTGYARTQLDGIPDHIRGLLSKMDVVDQLEWLTANREALGQKPDAPNLPQTPKPVEGHKMTDEQRREKAFRVSF